MNRKRLPFGLCNAPVTFTRLMQMVFKDVLWKTVMIHVYLDDINCHSYSFSSQLKVWSCISKVNWCKLKSKVCILPQKEVYIFIGHTISVKGVGTFPENIQAIKYWPTPKGAWIFVSFASYIKLLILCISIC